MGVPGCVSGRCDGRGLGQPRWRFRWLPSWLMLGREAGAVHGWSLHSRPARAGSPTTPTKSRLRWVLADDDTAILAVNAGIRFSASGDVAGKSPAKRGPLNVEGAVGRQMHTCPHHGAQSYLRLTTSLLPTQRSPSRGLSHPAPLYRSHTSPAAISFIRILPAQPSYSLSLLFSPSSPRKFLSHRHSQVSTSISTKCAPTCDKITPSPNESIQRTRPLRSWYFPLIHSTNGISA